MNKERLPERVRTLEEQFALFKGLMADARLLLAGAGDAKAAPTKPTIKTGAYPPAAAGKDGKKNEHATKESGTADPQYTSSDEIVIHYQCKDDKGAESDCTVTITVKLEYTFESDSEIKKDYVQYCVTYKIKVTVTVKDSCNPGKDKTYVIETEHKFCDGETDKPTPGLTQGFGDNPLEGPSAAGLKYPHGTKITAKQDKDKKSITIVVTDPDPPGGTATLTIPSK